MTVLENLYRNIARKSPLDADRNTMAAAAKEIEKLEDLANDMMTLLDEMPIKHPQQAERRDALRARMQKTA